MTFCQVDRLQTLTGWLLASLSRCECEQPGVFIQYNDIWVSYEAYLDAERRSGPHYLDLRGSFKAKVNGDHTFAVTCETWGLSATVSKKADLDSDGVNRAAEGNKSCSSACRSFCCQKDSTMITILIKNLGTLIGLLGEDFGLLVL